MFHEGQQGIGWQRRFIWSRLGAVCPYAPSLREVIVMPPTTRYTVRLSPALAALVQERIRTSGTPFAVLLREALSAYLAASPPPGPLPPRRQRRHSLRAPGAARRLDHAGRGAQARASTSAASPPPARCHSEGTHARGTAQTYPAPGESAADEARTWDPHQGAHRRVWPVEGDGVTRRRATSPRSCGRTAPLPAAPASQPMAPARWLRPRWPRRAD